MVREENKELQMSLDMDWARLIMQAKMIGLSTEDVRNYLKNAPVSVSADE